MKFTVNKGDLESAKTEALIVGIHTGDKPLKGSAASIDRHADGAISIAEDLGSFSGKPNELAWAPAPGIPAEQLLLIGLGDAKGFNARVLGQAYGTAASACRKAGIKSVATGVPTARGLDASAAATAICEAMELASYDPGAYKTNSKGPGPLQRVELFPERATASGAVRQGVTRGLAMAEGVLFTRDLVNRPSNLLTPQLLAKEARALAKGSDTITCRVLGPPAIAKLGMGGLLGVGQGSHEPVQFIQLEYKPARLKQSAPTIAIIGKGITFDTGGISIKPAASMDLMKFDMGGAAAVLGGFRILETIRPQVHVLGYIAAAENMPSGNAIKPGDLLKMMNGMTVEVNNTDAEGRLVLADALEYARREEPAFMVDAATLTGACMIALGDVAAGLMSEDDKLVKLIERASKASGDAVWRLPLEEVHRKKMKGHVADLKNTGPREGGALTAAGFLSYFAKDVPWAHLDIAGTVWTDESSPTEPKGATGYGARLFASIAETAANGWR